MLGDNLGAVVVVLVVCATVIAHRQWSSTFVKSSTTPSPPGPPAKWLIGNLLKIPKDKPWITFTKWKEEYGPLVYFYGLGNSILVLNTQEAINTLLDKRGNNYSHRPVFTVAGELMGLDNSIPIMPYGNVWRFHRKLAHKVLNPEAVKQYHIVQENLVVLMCHAFLKCPEDFMAQVRLAAGRIVMAVTYGLPVQGADDRYIRQAEKTMEIISEATIPGVYLVDLFPSLKHLPSWAPFTTFRKDGIKGHEMIKQLITDPFEHVRQQMKLGTARPSFTKELLETPQGSSEDEIRSFEDTVKWVAGAMYGAGGETTYATTLTFIMAMAMHPEIQRKAQREVDEIIGLDRLPEIADRPNVPYVNAVIKETMRWHPVLPLSIARRSEKDDVYGGYFIPAGTIVIPNIWSLASECITYPATDFVPERFLETNGPQDPHSYSFGFGRRICPGKLLGENSIFILIISLLACFDFYPPLDETGKELPLTPKYSSGLVNYPERYRCRIVPRSPARSVMIENRATSCSV